MPLSGTTPACWKRPPGFLLPLSMSASLLLLLSSLSLQMAVLHSRRIQATAGDRQQVDDADWPLPTYQEMLFMR